MRLLIGILVVSIMVTFAGRADAIGRTPGHVLQSLGWGFGAGYHAPIAHAHSPIQRMVSPAPEQYWPGGTNFGQPLAHPPLRAPLPHYVPSAAPAPAPPPSFEVLPEVQDGEILMPPAGGDSSENRPPAPPESSGEATAPAEAAAARTRY